MGRREAKGSRKRGGQKIREGEITATGKEDADRQLSNEIET